MRSGGCRRVSERDTNQDSSREWLYIVVLAPKLKTIQKGVWEDLKRI